MANQWKNKFIDSIQSKAKTVSSWPIMKSHHCHCAYWMKHEQTEQFFAKEMLLQIDQAHDHLHTDALNLQTLYLKGDIQAARGRCE